MNVFEILAIIITIGIILFLLLSLLGGEDNPSHFESWRRKRHKRKEQEAAQKHDLEKYQMDYEVRMTELSNERYKLEIQDSMSKISDIDYDKDKEV